VHQQTAHVAQAAGDPRVHAAFDGRQHCLCGAPILRVEPTDFLGRDPLACPICALAVALHQDGRRQLSDS
jgi:hypothetical protein